MSHVADVSFYHDTNRLLDRAEDHRHRFQVVTRSNPINKDVDS